MRRFTFLAALASIMLLGTQMVNAQAVRNTVVVEIFTGTWCVYCPGAAMGADDLVENSHKVAIVEHHDGGSDPFKTAESTARTSYYNVTGHPTAWFDGTTSTVGGSNSSSMYASYLTRYTPRIAAATPFDIDFTWTQNGSSIDVVASITQVGSYSAGNLRMQAVLTESHIPYNWQGQSEVNFVNRDMYPDQNGTPITITQGNTVTQNFSMAINPLWNQNKMELVVWLENSSTKVIFNGKMKPIWVSANTNDPAALLIKNEIPSAACMTSIAPVIVIRNLGSADLNSLDIVFGVNGATQTYNWTGNLPFYTFLEITLPSTSFTPQPNNTLTVNLTNPNGGVDGVMTNNNLSKNWARASEYATGNYTLTLQLDDYGSETTWKFKNGSGATILSGGPYADNNRQLITQVLPITTVECFTFEIIDSYGDGICCQYGPGYFNVKDPFNNVIITGGAFGAKSDIQWTSNPALAVNRDITNEISVYPNPSAGMFNLNLGKDYIGGADITVLDIAGKTVFQTNASQQNLKLDLTSLASGMYMLKIRTEEGVAVKKLNKE